MSRRILQPQKHQRGVVAVLVTIAMVAMLGLAGLALDGGHTVLSLSRLQNTLDSAALSAAKTLNQTNGDTVLAQVEALSMFADNANDAGNREINDAYTAGDISISVEFSNTLNPFANGTVPARYVRVSATGFELDTWFLSVLGVDEIPVDSSAVAGPSPALERICNVAPIMVCADPAVPNDPLFGYTPGMPYVLKGSSPNDDSVPGPGNFQLIRLENYQGGADIRRALAGDFNACVNVTEEIETEPGNTVGPTIQGINTRLGSYQGPLNGAQDEYPPDVVVTQVQPALTLATDGVTVQYQGQAINEPADVGYYDYASYSNDVANGNYDHNPLDGDPPGIGAFGRRTLPVPVGDCSDAGGGQQTLPLLGVMCFHMLQSASVQGDGGGNGNEARIFGEFVDGGCGVTGNPGDTPGDGPGPYVIQLYKDPNSIAS